MILRLWLLVVLTLAGAFAPSRASARTVETRTWDFFAATTNARPESAPQVADSRLGFEGHGYELAPGYSQAAETTAAAEARGGTYLLRDAEGNVARTGRTNDLLRREAELARDPALKDLDFEPVHRTDVYNEQRGLEQLLHDTYNPPLNKVRPIGPNNPNLQKYLDAANGYLGNP